MQHQQQRYRLTHGISREQFDRLQFAYKKAVSECAYVRTLEKLLDRERQANAQRNES